ncbi:cupin 2 barrel domain-containing protein [Halosimplex carlsbadense 2-9-1]|uniref:Cupin 2 barrel domain-containing protein n=1 Tax=Halosimplex carlsbadense 2-9-1 TaxID=797114 RepID=M0CRL2_9EURY|nr:cupin domain-containing protein [Halosimplex carlsbadense]ELZ25012.1 cupin 2 barrel domain-containing protein [Halosimplex carlsbadense 2-9-1]
MTARTPADEDGRDRPTGTPYVDDDWVRSPPAGKTVLFTERPDDPDRDPLRFEMWLDADGSHGPMAHVHPEQDEFFEVVAGRLGVSREGTTTEYGPGERAEIPAGDEHRFWNAGSTELHLRGGVDPGLRTETFMRITYGLARDGEPVTPSGMVLNLLRVAVLLAEFDDMLYLAGAPVTLQRLGVELTAPLGRLLGYDNEYREYRP